MFPKRRKMWMVGGNLVVAIPRDVARYYKLEAGKEIDTYYYDNKLIVDLASPERARTFDTLAKAPEQEPVVAAATAQESSAA